MVDKKEQSDIIYKKRYEKMHVLTNKEIIANIYAYTLNKKLSQFQLYESFDKKVKVIYTVKYQKEFFKLEYCAKKLETRNYQDLSYNPQEYKLRTEQEIFTSSLRIEPEKKLKQIIQNNNKITKPCNFVTS